MIFGPNVSYCSIFSFDCIIKKGDHLISLGKYYLLYYYIRFCLISQIIKGHI